MVELCGCGAMHLTIGAITLRLAPEAGVEIARILGEGARQWMFQRAAELGGSKSPALPPEERS